MCFSLMVLNSLCGMEEQNMIAIRLGVEVDIQYTETF